MNIAEFHDALKNKKTSVREVTISYLEKIKKASPVGLWPRENAGLNAYLEVFEKEATARAEDLDKRIAEGEKITRLMGVPIAVKDNILIQGHTASAASKILENYTASYDAFVIEKLKKAGAIFLGRTNMDEFAMGSSTENSAYGVVKNPHDPERVAGGSSGGSAAAVAAGMAMGALGSETGGSIRQPSAFCGTVGLKTTYGAVSRSGLMAMASSLDQIGPVAMTVEDTKKIFNVIAGKDELDATSTELGGPTANGRTDRQVAKIGVPREYFGDGLDPRIKKTIDGVIEKLGKNYEIVEISLPYTKYALACYYIIVPAEVSSNMARYDGIRYGARKEGKDLLEVYKKSRGEGIGLEVRRRILLGTYVLSHGYYDAYYTKAQKVRSLIKKDFDNAFVKVDVILAPTTPTLPFKIGEKAKDPLSMYLSDIYTIPVNLAGIPALSLPVGWAEESGKKLPVGMQIIAPHFEEVKLFELGKIIESWTK
ncbi:glutaminyl-tRNA synthase (glutamine-hydrolyzing) subunit A [Candidatus Giovannonibacteria bacterium RIFCSPHIGHO2_01_FULL_45_33]|uniref:Glutamyl-tRNA(Gln) amidotransferase subunit A n=1 Tax=Candidatus Giovannonibacteria bacterium RIFCSPLOWO2_01_FULL_45_34 TaxID=1798351 RepID=A0A1F5WYR4_9BACT|nr:MAG: glutaminyl-tRNA synthase (glutamine-hydrolyzing) subunit A [Candidatus Giovannonibacteria bacterium RIFCSPHIGHO2_01_FULL_45_33]OGF80770.1 MAG: glutaminyl-tRNA synthase (glutamine-hydrolyzing) subunit A [Candidatus Giovannonibacteria bacterium RIFCSPLOWO2_01_FULL_45_34]